MKMRTLGVIGWLLLALAIFAPEAAHATGCGSGTGTCFVTAAGGNWNTSGTWSDTDGGASCACTPATGDELFATSASGNSTINASISAKAFDANGFTGTLTHSAATLTITGNDAAATNGVAFRLSSGMTYTATASTRIVSMTSTSGTATITTNGKTLGALVLDGVGGTFALGGDLTVRSDSTITLTNGTLSATTQNVSVGTFSSTSSNTRTLTMGSGTWTITGCTSVGTNWNVTGTNLTVTATTSTISYNNGSTCANVRAFVGGSKTYGNFSAVNSGVVAGLINFNTGSNSFTNVTFTEVYNARIASSTTLTITGTLAWTGPNATNQGYLGANGDGTGALVLSNNTSLSYLMVQQIARSGAGSLSVTNGFDGGGNTGTITITGPAGGSRCIGC